MGGVPSLSKRLALAAVGLELCFLLAGVSAAHAEDLRCVTQFTDTFMYEADLIPQFTNVKLYKEIQTAICYWPGGEQYLISTSSRLVRESYENEKLKREYGEWQQIRRDYLPKGKTDEPNWEHEKVRSEWVDRTYEY